MTDPHLTAAAHWIRDADALVITAGAGMGVDSGLPDFRGNEGFWRAYPALKLHGLSFVEAASPQTFRDDPALAWGFYGHRLDLYRRTQPHAGFRILRQWAESKPYGAWVFTSNVDGQFQRAGFERVYECHGSIHHLQCTRPCGHDIWPAEGLEPVVDTDACRLTSPLPTCPHCGALARPNILMFGDGAWLEQRSEAQAEALNRWLGEARRIVSIELGAGTAVPSVRHFNHRLVQRHDARLVRINPTEEAVSPAMGVGLRGGALEVLSQLAPLVQAS